MAFYESEGATGIAELAARLYHTVECHFHVSLGEE